MAGSMYTRLVWILVYLVGFYCPDSEASDVLYQIKTSYIYNVLQFVCFPESSLQSKTVNVCVLGENGFGNALNEVDGAKTPQGNMHVLRLGSYHPRLPLEKCNLLYLMDSERASSAAILHNIDPQQILTISESPSFIEHGGLIELYLADDSLRFRINVELAKTSKYRIDAQLIQLGAR